MAVTADDFPRVLRGSVWHTTSHDRYKQILLTRAILPEPPIPESERWAAACGPCMYPFVRSIGGISLFDFSEFDPVAYSEAYPLSRWRDFVPYSTRWGASVWLDINTAELGDSYLSAKQVLSWWREEKEKRRKVMPQIEGASLIPIPLSAIRRVLQSSAEVPALVALAATAPLGEL